MSPKYSCSSMRAVVREAAKYMAKKLYKHLWGIEVFNWKIFICFRIVKIFQLTDKGKYWDVFISQGKLTRWKGHARLSWELLLVLQFTNCFLNFSRKKFCFFQPWICMFNFSLAWLVSILFICFDLNTYNCRLIVFVILMNHENIEYACWKFFQCSICIFSLLSQTEIISGSWGNPGGNKSISLANFGLWFGKVKFTYEVFQ